MSRGGARMWSRSARSRASRRSSEAAATLQAVADGLLGGAAERQPARAGFAPERRFRLRILKIDLHARRRPLVLPRRFRRLAVADISDVAHLRGMANHVQRPPDPRRPTHTDGEIETERESDALATHWKGLVVAITAIMAAAFILPPFLPPPSLNENRALAARPIWPKRMKDIRSFRAQADAYISDHFPARANLIALLNRARMVVGGSGSDKVIIGRDGWLFFDIGTHLGAARNEAPMEAVAVRHWLLHLAGRTEKLRSRGIAYLVVIGPTKETIYPQFAPTWMGSPSPDRPTLVLPRLASAAHAGDVLYLHQAVETATRSGWKTFSRHDTHWTGYGAYAAYTALLSRLHAMNVTDGPLPFSSFTMVPDRKSGPKDLADMLGVAGMVGVDFPHIANPEGEAKARTAYLTEKHDPTALQIVDSGAVGKPILLMTRDSFSHELLPLLLPHFSKIILAHNQDGFWREDLIERFKPDVVILETIEHGLPLAMDDGPRPTKAAAESIQRTLLASGWKGSEASFAPSRGAILQAMNTAKPAKHCAIDEQSLRPAGAGAVTVSANGWIFARPWSPPSPVAYLRLHGKGADLTIPIHANASRPDVSQALHDPTAAKSGFRFLADILSLQPGRYSLVVYRQSGRDLVSCISPNDLFAPSVN